SISAAAPKPLIMTLAPSWARARAMARPIPEVEPVTTAFFPFSMIRPVWFPTPALPARKGSRRCCGATSMPQCRGIQGSISPRNLAPPRDQHGEERRPQKQPEQAEALDTAQDAEQNPDEWQPDRAADEDRANEMIGDEHYNRAECQNTDRCN